MTLRKTAGLLAVAGLIVGLAGSGVAASFVDQVTGQENISVGTFACQITGGDGVIGNSPHTGSTITYTVDPILSSAASNAPFTFTVKNFGTIDQSLTVAASPVAGSLNPAKFSAMPVTPTPIGLAAGASQTFNTGIQWSELDNTDLGDSGSVTWTVSCNEATVVVKTGNMAASFAAVAADPSKWFFYNDETDQIDASLGSMVAGPGTAPAGAGSAQISVTGTQRRNLATYRFSGTPLANITVLRFSTYNPSAGNGGSANRSGYLNFNVDFNGSDTWQKRLVFVPSQNGSVIQNQWQEWDAINGGSAMWSYSGATWPSTATPGTTLRSWNDIVTSYPGIRIRVTDSWLGVRVGEPYADGYTENIDLFKFGTSSGTVKFDFEP